MINNLNSAADMYNNDTYWSRLIQISSTDESEIVDEPTFLRDSIIRFCVTVGGKQERGEESKFKIERISVSNSQGSCSSLGEALSSSSVVGLRSFIGESCLVSISVNSKELQEFGKINLGRFGRKFSSSYFKSIYGKDVEPLEHIPLSWSKILSILLFGEVQQASSFISNNPFLDLISNNQEVILEIASQVEKVLYKEYPTHFNSYILCGLSITNVVTRWLRQLFFNFLDLRCIFQMLAIVKEFGLESLVFFCVLFLKEQSSFEFCQEYKLEAWTHCVYDPIDVDSEWLVSKFEKEFKILREKYTVRLSFEKSN